MEFNRSVVDIIQMFIILHAVQVNFSFSNLFVLFYCVYALFVLILLLFLFFHGDLRLAKGNLIIKAHNDHNDTDTIV